MSLRVKTYGSSSSEAFIKIHILLCCSTPHGQFERNRFSKCRLSGIAVERLAWKRLDDKKAVIRATKKEVGSLRVPLIMRFDLMFSRLDSNAINVSNLIVFNLKAPAFVK